MFPTQTLIVTVLVIKHQFITSFQFCLRNISKEVLWIRNVCALMRVLDDGSVTSMKCNMFQNATDPNKHGQQSKTSAQLIKAWAYACVCTHTHAWERVIDHSFPKVSHSSYTHISLLLYFCLTKPCCLVQGVAERQTKTLFISKPVYQERKGSMKERGEERWTEEKVSKGQEIEYPEQKSLLCQQEQVHHSSFSWFNINIGLKKASVNNNKNQIENCSHNKMAA